MGSEPEGPKDHTVTQSVTHPISLCVAIAVMAFIWFAQRASVPSVTELNFFYCPDVVIFT